MSSKKLSARAAAWTGSLTVVVLLVAVALVSRSFLHGRLDLTRDRQFTLSPAAVRVLQALPDQVTARVVISRDLPVQFQRIRTQALDLLREFEARSAGKFTLVVEDPGEDEEKRKAAGSLGIQEVQLQEQSREGMQVKKGYFGLALLYGDRKEVFPVIQQLETLEYEIIVRLLRLTGRTRVIGVVEGSEGSQIGLSLPGQPAPARGFEGVFPALKANMEQLYTVRVVQPAWDLIDEDVDLLLVASPRNLTEVEKFRIDQYVMSGRPAIFLSPGMDVNVSTGITATPLADGYADLLAHYGVGVRRNLVLEPRQWEMVPFGNSMYPTPYPYWIVETYETLNPQNPVTAGLQTLSFPWASSLDLDTTAQPDAKIEPLVFTTEEAWEETGPLYLYPRELMEYRPENPRLHPLAALQSGRLTSRYASGAPAEIPPEEAQGALKASEGASRVLVVGNALFASDFYLSYTNATGNFHFLLNALDYLVLDPDLIRVRSRQIREAPLDEDRVSRLKMPLVLANLLLAPALLALVGAFVAVRRRNREAMS